MARTCSPRCSRRGIPSNWGRSHEPLRRRRMSDLLLALAGRGLSVLGLQILATAFVLSALERGGGPLFLGNMGLSAVLATLGSSFLLGHWVDRLGQRRAMIFSHSLLIVFTCLLALAPRPSPGA